MIWYITKYIEAALVTRAVLLDDWERADTREVEAVEGGDVRGFAESGS